MSQAKGGRARDEEEAVPEPEDASTADEGSSAGPAGPAPEHGHECLEWCPVCRSAELLKGVGLGVNSPEIRQQLQTIQSEAMQVFKAFAAAYTERAADDPFPRRGEESGSRERPGPGADPPGDRPIDISIE